MATAMIGAALSVVRTALSPLTNSLLEKWAASKDLGSNVRALQLELLAVQALLEHTAGKEIVDNSALKNLLVILQDLGYDAEDVLDELEYFRIQDELDGTFHAADEHAMGGAHNLALNAHHTAKAVGKLISLPSCFSATTAPGTRRMAQSDSTISTAPDTKQANRETNGWKANLGKCFPCSSLQSVRDNNDDNSPQRNHTDDEPPKLSFDRVDASTRMQHIVEQLHLVRGIVSSTITTLGPSCITVPNIAQSRQVTTSQSIETKLYGRETLMRKIIDQITDPEGKYYREVLSVIPIVGLGGMGKTTLAQHIYHSGEVQEHFDVRVWICVSLNFNVNSPFQVIEKQIPKVKGESGTATTGELIEQRLQNKRVLLVLDDIWDCSNEDEWKHLLVPFKKSQILNGSIIMVTTRFRKQANLMVQKVDHTVYLEGLGNDEFKELFLDIIFDEDQSRKDYTSFHEIGNKIAGKLMGSPLAAKTVGRLLRNQLDLVHWEKILLSKEWEEEDGNNDIMPALKLSYHYLPPRLQHCFSYCALFPQDYRFKEVELINFWIGLNVLHSSHGSSKRVEDIGESNLRELVHHGFLEKNGQKDVKPCYIIHDLLHDLARKVSSYECLSIYSSQSHVRSLNVPPSIRHLSINIEDNSVKDRFILKNCVEGFNTLFTRLKVEKLRTLMLFGAHHCFLKALDDLLVEAKALRVIFISEASYFISKQYDMEDLLHNFDHLLHLRYLRIGSHLYVPTTKISRFYQMMVLDAEQCNIFDLPRGMSNLRKLRHFLVKNDTIHSKIVEVGKLKSLQELKSFVVKQEGQGFELRQIGHLEEICGSLCISNLENVKTTKEADEAKLMQKNCLRELILCWSITRPTNDSTLEEHVLERLRPNSSLLKLSIKGHRGTTCPSWLGTNLSVRNLETLCLEHVSWKYFPPIGEFWLEGMENISSSIPDKRFGNLRSLVLCELTMFKEWVVHAPCQLFPFLEVLIIKDCPRLEKLSFQHFGCSQQREHVNVNWFPRLWNLEIEKCPQLSSVPPIPWTKAPRSSIINLSLGNLVCGKLLYSGYRMTIEGNNDTIHSTFWDMLIFHNLTGLKELRMFSCESLPLCNIQMLSSLRTLEMSCSSNVFSFVEADSRVKYQFPVELLTITQWNASGKQLTQLLTYLPKLSILDLSASQKQVTGMGVNVRGHPATQTPGPSSAAIKVGPIVEEEIVASSEEAERGLLLLPPQLQELLIYNCPDLSVLPSSPHDDSNKEEARSGGGGGLQGLTSLRRLAISHCPKLLAAYSSSCFSASFPFPNSLKHLYITEEVGSEVLPLSNLASLTGLSLYNLGEGLLRLSNLTSLTYLEIRNCGDLRGKGLWPLLAQGHLTYLSVKGTPNFFIDSYHSQVHEQEIASCSSKLQELEIDDVAGFTAAPLRHSMHLPLLTKLDIFKDNKVERFTEEQEALLFVNSLEYIEFLDCPNLQSLPDRLHRLSNLKRLGISWSNAIQMLPKDGLPSSLEELGILNCPEMQSIPKDCLPDSLQRLLIAECPAIRSLPDVDDLPSSLQTLDVKFSQSEELRSQCRKLINIIPIVRVD